MEKQKGSSRQSYASPLSYEQQSDSEVVAGRNAVRELLRSGRPVDKILLQKSENRTGSILMLLREALEKKIPVVEVEKAKLDSLAGEVPHQGIIAFAAETEEADLQEVEKLLEALEETTITKERFEQLLAEAGKETDDTAPYYSDTIALVIDGEEISPAKLTYCLANQFQSFVSSYGQYAAYFGLDVSGGIAGLAEQKCAMLEEGTWLDFFLQQAVDSLQQSIALRRIAAEEGIAIAEEETAEMRESFEEFDTIVQQYGYADGNEFITANYGLGNNVDSLLNFLTEFALAGRVYDQFEQQFRENVTTEEILEQFPDPTISIRHILIMAEQDENGEWTDEAKEAAKVRAEEILQEWAAGDATEE